MTDDAELQQLLHEETMRGVRATEVLDTAMFLARRRGIPTRIAVHADGTLSLVNPQENAQ